MRFLVVENDERWRKAVQKNLAQAFLDVRVDVAESAAETLALVGRQSYELIVVDLSLHNDPEDGFRLIEQIRRGSLNSQASLLILTGHGSTERIHQALQHHGVFRLVDKNEYNSEDFVRWARAAILDGRLGQAENQANSLYRLIVTFDESGFLGGRLSGPDIQEPFTCAKPSGWDIQTLAERADRLDILIRSELREGAEPGEYWRSEARAIGNEIHAALHASKEIAENISAAFTKADPADRLALCFSGPCPGLRVPFELTRNRANPLCFEHMIVRQINGLRSTKPQSLKGLIRQLAGTGSPLRVLLVGAFEGKDLPSVQKEVALLKEVFEEQGSRLGAKVDLIALLGENANFENVREALRQECHLFHYAGHGGFNPTHPERSGFVLFETQGRVLRSVDLYQLTKETQLCFAFLNCCVSAQTAQRPGRGDFHGTLEALARADVPRVLGHRWIVDDQSALEFARSFYRSLWKTFSVGRALLKARVQASMGPRGREDPTWASPILVNQAHR